MKDLIEYIARSIATKPDEVEVTVVEEGEGILLRLEVAEDDKGKIIGDAYIIKRIQ